MGSLALMDVPTLVVGMGANGIASPGTGGARGPPHFATLRPMESGSAQYILKHTFGYDSFRGFQQEVIDHVVAGGDALVLMPTGGGKSITYQIPALLRHGVG